MKRQLTTLVILLLIAVAATAQDNIVAVARYNGLPVGEVPKFRYDDSLTEFKGGFEAFWRAFNRQFKFSESGFRHGKADEAVIGFTVSRLGKVVAVEVVESISPEIDSEAVRVLSEMQGFLPQKQDIRLAVLLDPFPEWLKKNWRYAEAQQRAQAADSVLQKKNWRELEAAVDPTQAYMTGGFWLGTAVSGDRLADYLPPMFQVGGMIGIAQNRWHLGINVTWRGGRLRREFILDNQKWAKDTMINVFGIGGEFGFKSVQQGRFGLTPFIGLTLNVLEIPSSSQDETYNSATILSFLPTFGAYMDYKIRHKASTFLNDSYLSTTAIRLRLAVNMANFKDKRQGNILDLGIGLAFGKRALKEASK